MKVEGERCAAVNSTAIYCTVLVSLPLKKNYIPVNELHRGRNGNKSESLRNIFMSFLSVQFWQPRETCSSNKLEKLLSSAKEAGQGFHPFPPQMF